MTAEKEGYVLSGPNSKGEFSAHKLAEVIVTVKDKADGQPLQVSAIARVLLKMYTTFILVTD